MAEPDDRLRLALARAALDRPLDIAHWLRLAGEVTPERLADEALLREAALPPSLAAGVLHDSDTLEEEAGLCHQHGWRALALCDREYPALLATLEDAPPVLFVQGDIRLLSQPQIAMVGSRHPSADGRVTARSFARALAEAGFCITSGLALGIDGHAHRGALEGGTTLAVLGSGPDNIYPARHQALAREVAERGALVTEYPPGTAALPRNFPRRNRIISGLSLATVVVEAAIRSGSLITARLAAEQGREVFAIPGSIHNPLSKGCHRLLRDGARWLESVDDVLEALDALHALAGAAGEETGVDEAADPLLEAFTGGINSLDQLHQRTGLSPDTLGQRLAELEISGWVERLPGGYQRVPGAGRC